MQGGYSGEQYGDNFQGGSGVLSNGNSRNFNNYNGRAGGSNNFKKFGGGNNNFKNSSSGFHNRNANEGSNHNFANGNNNYSRNGKAHQNGGNGYSGSSYGNEGTFSGNGSSKGYSKPNWTGNTNFKSSVSPECQICSRRGHTVPNCYYRSDSGTVQSSGPVMCQICGKKGHIALECFHRNNYAYHGNPPPPSLAMTAQTYIDSNAATGLVSSNDNGHGFSTEDNWIIDTGATHHMTANLNHLNNATPYTSDEKITIGNGTCLSVTHIGSTSIYVPHNTIVLKNVLCVPTITVNLLSVKQLCKDNGCWFICDDVIFFIQDKATRKILYQGNSDGGELFTIPVNVFAGSFAAKLGQCSAFLGKKVQVSVWHRRLGHPSEEVLAAMLKKSKVIVSADCSQSLCSSCISGKMTRQPFHVKQSRATFLFEKIHTDVWGPSPKLSVQGYRYYISFVDEYSRFLWIFPMNNKSQAFDIFVRFYAFVLNQFNVTVKCLQSDGGGEFLSKTFINFLENKGISHMISCPYTP